MPITFESEPDHRLGFAAASQSEVETNEIAERRRKMPTDDRDTLEVLKAELDFIEKGGYGRSVRTPWLPTSMFQDSLTCLNFGDPQQRHPCDECLLMALVPAERRSEKIPCHHIPLNPGGETVDFLERNGTQDEMEERVKNWLRNTIKFLEEIRSAPLSRESA
jgi:hypothetical protein